MLWTGALQVDEAFVWLLTGLSVVECDGFEYRLEHVTSHLQAPTSCLKCCRKYGLGYDAFVKLLKPAVREDRELPGCRRVRRRSSSGLFKLLKLSKIRSKPTQSSLVTARHIPAK